MIITIKDSKEVWKSPDGQRQIWEVTDGDGQTWQTMSRQIAQAINQSTEVTTRVSDKGKTYLVKPPQEPVDGVRAPGQVSLPIEVVERLVEVLVKLERHLDKPDYSDAYEKIGGEDQVPVELYDDLAQADLVDDL